MKKKLNFDNAACADLPMEVMFPGKNALALEAKRTCAKCEHQQECLLGAIRSEELHGVWGGVNFENSQERRNAKKFLAAGSKYTESIHIEAEGREFMSAMAAVGS